MAERVHKDGKFVIYRVLSPTQDGQYEVRGGEYNILLGHVGDIESGKKLIDKEKLRTGIKNSAFERGRQRALNAIGPTLTTVKCKECGKKLQIKDSTYSEQHDYVCPECK